MRVEARLSPAPIPSRWTFGQRDAAAANWRLVLLAAGVVLAVLGSALIWLAAEPVPGMRDDGRSGERQSQGPARAATQVGAFDSSLRQHLVAEPAVTVQPEPASVRNASRYAPALARLLALPGPERPWLKTLHDEVRMACALVHRPDGASARVDLDASRRPWLDALQQRCGGLPPEMLEPLAGNDPIQQAWRQTVPANREVEAGAAAAKRLAVELLRESADAALLHEALRHLLADDDLPLEQIYRGRTPPVRIDLEAALAPASDLVACRRSASCGAEGLSTIYLCAQLGCPPGSDLDQALRWLLPKAQYENALRMAHWVEGQGLGVSDR